MIGFGIVSLAVDLVADGARSVSGPLLASLGASALTVGIVTGAAEAAGFGLRLVSGPLVDRTRKYWGFAIGGYVLTVLCVPLLALTPLLGPGAFLAAAFLVVLERVGKAIRSPAKTVLLAHAATAVGGGRGFGVHKLLDQVGAFSGPLLVAAVIAISGALWPAFAVLAIPGVVALALLLWMRSRVPDPGAFAREPGSPSRPAPVADTRGRLPGSLYLFGISAALTSFGLVGYGVISFHLTEGALIALAAVPLVFAVGMVAGALASVITGRAYDSFGAGVLLLVPVLVASIREFGVLEPVGCRRTPDGGVIVRMGRRRVLAAREAKASSIPAFVVEGDDSTVQRVLQQYAENEHRAGLTEPERVEQAGRLGAGQTVVVHEGSATLRAPGTPDEELALDEVVARLLS